MKSAIRCLLATLALALVTPAEATIVINFTASGTGYDVRPAAGSLPELNFSPPTTGDIVHGTVTIETAMLPTADYDAAFPDEITYQTDNGTPFLSAALTSTGLLPFTAISGTGFSGIHIDLGQQLIQFAAYGPDNGSESDNGITHIDHYDDSSFDLFGIGDITSLQLDQIDFSRLNYFYIAQKTYGDEVYDYATDDYQSSDVRQIASYGLVQPAPAVPEPASWAMMLIGFGAIGGTMRARRRMRAPIA